MEIGETLYVTDRKEWRAWLKKNHRRASEIWLIYYRKSSGKPRIEYNDAVEEALCFGWIDSIEKGIDNERFAQRFTPRKPRSNWSETNKVRVRRLIEEGKMTKAGLEAAARALEDAEPDIAPDILEALKKDKETWQNFSNFSPTYRTIRIGWIEAARSRPEVFEQRLRYFLKMTKQNKKVGRVFTPA